MAFRLHSHWESCGESAFNVFNFRLTSNPPMDFHQRSYDDGSIFTVAPERDTGTPLLLCTHSKHGSLWMNEARRSRLAGSACFLRPPSLSSLTPWMEFQMKEFATEPLCDFVYTMKVNRHGWRSESPGRRRRFCAEAHGKHFLLVTLSSDGVPDARTAVRGLKDGIHRIPNETLYSKRR